MKGTLIVLLLVATACASYAQKGRYLVRHDTLRLQPGDRGWVVPVTGETGTETLPVFLLRTVASGGQKAYDPITTERIPSGSIYTWRQPVDTVMVMDEKKQVHEMKVVQHKLDPGSISSLRIYVDWLLDLETGKLKAETKCIELFRDIYSSSGMLIGKGAFCRIGDAP